MTDSEFKAMMRLTASDGCGKKKEAPPISLRDRKILSETDGHWCYDWDELAVSAWTPEYDCCVDFDKTLRGRFFNWLYMFKFNWRMRRTMKKGLLKTGEK